MGHLLLIGYPAWGHTRPITSLAAHLAKYHDVTITIFTTKYLFDKVRAELASHASQLTARGSIAVVSIGDESVPFMNLDIRKAFEQAIADIVSKRALRCTTTGTFLEFGSVPDVAVSDPLEYSFLETLRAADPKIKLLASLPGALTSYLRRWGPEKYGGVGDLEAKTKALVEKSSRREGDSPLGVSSSQARADIKVADAVNTNAPSSLSKIAAEMDLTGKDIKVAAEAILEYNDGSLVNLAGLPPYYDYEQYPQKMLWPTSAFIFMKCHRFLLESDGVISCTSSAFEPEAIQAFGEWFGETNRPVFTVGPLLPIKQDANGNLLPGLERTQESEKVVVEFLDGVLAKHGEGKLIYISFGTTYWSTQPEAVWALLDEIIKLEIPFIFVHASPFAKVPEEITAKVRASGLGYLCPWGPQVAILSHLATGWFLCHCGQNSVLESLSFGVPLICWPFNNDQPLNAMRISLKLNVGYELVQVRTGERGLKPLRRIKSDGDQPQGDAEAVRRELEEVLAKAMGEDGAKKRAAARELKAKTMEGWNEGGEAREGLAGLAKFVS